LPAWNECTRGKIVTRELRAATISAEACGMPHARQVLRLEKRTTFKKSGRTENETHLFITSLDTGQASPQRLADIIRGHWSVENKNHWCRDATRWREDHCRLRRPNAAFNLALLRNTMLALIPSDFRPFDAAFDYYLSHPAAAITLLTRTRHPK
jgi:predicted transposase YbfD/YdcC